MQKSLACKHYYIRSCVFACIIIFITSCRNTPNYNLSFENIDSLGYPSGWTFSQLNMGYLVTIDTSVSQDQHLSTSIEYVFGSNGSGACTYELASPLQGHEIQLTGYIKTENVKNGFAGLWVRIEDINQEIIGFKTMADSGINGTQNWKKCSITIPFNAENADRIYFGGLLTGSGKSWIDHLQLTVDGRAIESLPLKKLEKAELDKSFIRGSGISKVSLNDQTVKNLTNLGMLWGFLKYYHSRVESGDLNWDAELFRILPEIISCRSAEEANKAFEKWLDRIGPSQLASKPNLINDSLVKMQANYGFLFSDNTLSPKITAQLKKMRDYHLPIDDSHYLSFNKDVNNPIFRHEKSYSGNLYPDSGYRILALFRYWNYINYCYPYRYHIEGDWNEILMDFIPKFLHAADKTDYAKICTELICRINDGHASISGNPALDSLQGKMTAPFDARFIENELVVTGVSGLDIAEKGKLNPGDIITSIDGEPVKGLVEKYLPLTHGSNRNYRLFKMAANTGWLLRSSRTSMTLKIERGGITKEVKITKIPFKDYYDKFLLHLTETRKGRGYKLMNGNIGYLYAAQLKDKDLESIKELFKNTKGVIIDLRCYPNTPMPYEYGKWLKEIASPFASFTKSSLLRPGVFVKDMTVSNGLLESGAVKYKYNFSPVYAGKVIILVNESSISQSEFTAMALQSIPGAVVMGSQTAGADGNVSGIVLPGQINTMISGIGVYYPDGTETQGKGVKINEVIEPTVEGIRLGKDELMEHAVAEILSREIER